MIILNKAEIAEIADVIDMLGNCECKEAMEGAEKLFAIVKPHMVKQQQPDYRKDKNKKK